jgi:hypothetical protein
LKLLKTIWKGVYNRIILISPTFKVQFREVWSQLSPEGITVYETIDDDLIKRLHLECQGWATKKESTLVIVDDCGQALRSIKPDAFSLWVSNSRHCLVSIVHLSQKLTYSPPIFRSNADTILAFGATSALDRDALWREFSIYDRKTFLALFEKATKKPFSFMACCLQRGGVPGLFHSDLKTPLVL